MGIFDSFFSSDKKTSSSSSSTTTPNLPDWLKAALNQNTQSGLNQLEQMAGQTADQRIVGFTPDELAAQERVRQGTGQYDDIIKNALMTMQSAQSGVNPDDIQKFMNPYTQNVVDITKREAVRDADQQRNQLATQAAAAGAFGGSRFGIQGAELNRNLGQNLSDIQYKGLSDAYAQALEAARQSNSMAIQGGQAIANTAGQGNTIYNQNTGALAASGEAQRGLAQAETDFTYTNPLQTILQGSQLINTNAPLYGTTTTGQSTQTTPSAGWGSQLLGSALAIGAMGTGGGATLGGSLLGGWLGGGNSSSGAGENNYNVTGLAGVGYADGGPVKKYADGGKVTSGIDSLGVSKDINSTIVANKLSPLERMATEGIQGDTDISRDITSSDNDVIEGLLPPPVGFEGGSNDSTPLGAPRFPDSEPITITSPDRSNVITELEQASLKAEQSTPDLTSLLTNKQPPKEKSRMEKMMEDTNLPLLKMGLAMMASDKPFFQAVGEGGLVGAEQLAADRKLEHTSGDENLDRQIKLMQLEDAKQRTIIASKNSEVYANKGKSLTGEKKLAFDSLKTQLKLVNDKIISGMVPRDQIPSLELTQQKLIESMDKLTSTEGLSSDEDTGNIQEDVAGALSKQLDFKDYNP